MARSIEITHKIMSAIKSCDTVPEMLLRRALWRRGFRYRVNCKRLIGKPDIVFSKAKIAIFCDGDFWHGHNWAIRGLSCLDDELSGYSDFWRNKILNNIKRDSIVTSSLASDGWTVLRFWESDILSNLNYCVTIIENQYKENIQFLNNDYIIDKQDFMFSTNYDDYNLSDNIEDDMLDVAEPTPHYK